MALPSSIRSLLVADGCGRVLLGGSGSSFRGLFGSAALALLGIGRRYRPMTES